MTKLVTFQIRLTVDKHDKVEEDKNMVWINLVVDTANLLNINRVLLWYLK